MKWLYLVATLLAITFKVYAEKLQISEAEVMRLVESAKSNQAILPYYITTQRLATLPNGKEIISTKYHSRGNDHGEFVRTVVGLKSTKGVFRITTLRIKNDKGSWEIHGNVAIRVPDEMYAKSENEIEGATSTIGILKKYGARWDAEGLKIDGRDYVKIHMVFPDSSIPEMRALVKERMKASAIAQAEQKLGRKFQTDDFVVGRFEYIIDKEKNFITTYASISITNKVTEKHEYLTVEIPKSISEDLFRIPASARMLFPSTVTEYKAMSAQYGTQRGKLKK